jgi:hypothetical protein
LLFHEDGVLAAPDAEAVEEAVVALVAEEVADASLSGLNESG